jgi:DnaK suppressor protein
MHATRLCRDYVIMLSEEQLNQLKQQTLKLLKELQHDLAEAKKSSGPVVLDQQAFGRVSRVDAIQQQQMQAASVRRLELKLEQTKAAIKRFNAGTYGFCLACEEPIQLKRLQAQPETPLCVQCAK